MLAIITGANLFTEPYLLTGGGGPDGASTTPVLLIYQKGIQQGNPDVASALGVILVIVVLIIGAGQHLAQRAGEQVTLTENGPDLATATVGRKPGRGGQVVTYILLVIGALAVPVPVLLHGGRLPADGARHHGRRRLPESRRT